MKRNQTRIIVATAISAAVIAVAVDHTRQRLPEPEKQLASQEAVIIINEGEALPDESNVDCETTVARGRRASPCSL
jgi:hypothetical protein